MKRSMALTLIFFLSLQSASAFQQADIQKLIRLRDKGQKAFTEKQYQLSIDTFKKFIEVLPKASGYDSARANAHYFVASGYAQLKETDDALKHLDLALKLGFRQFEAIAGDKDLDPIRDAPGYGAIIKKYKRAEEDKLQGFNFDLVTIAGKRVAKKDFIGKVLIADVWGTWCPPCRMEIPHFIELQKKYEKAGLQIIGLNREKIRSKEAAERHVKRFMEKSAMNYPCAIADAATIQSVPNLQGFPTTLFIGRDGRVRTKITGYHDYQTLERIVKPLLAEKPPASKGEKSATGAAPGASKALAEDSDGVARDR